MKCFKRNLSHAVHRFAIRSSSNDLRSEMAPATRCASATEPTGHFCLKNLANFILFQAGWFACVLAAADGRIWLAPFAVLLVVALHLFFISRPTDRRRELGFILLVGLFGMLADSGLRKLGATHYPTSNAGWPPGLAPVWVGALWSLFATLPCHSLGWLRGRPLLTAVLGAVGGPLSYLAGTRLGATGLGDHSLLTFGALGIEYALLTPLLLHFVPSSE